MNQGGMSLGEPVISFLSRSLKYAFDHSLAGLTAFLLGSVRLCERNLRFPRILMQLRPGMAVPSRRFTTVSNLPFLPPCPLPARATSSWRDPASGPSSAPPSLRRSPARPAPPAPL